MTRNPAIADQAIAWHLHLGDAGEQDWRTFIDWLAADPEHAAAYDRVTLDDALLGGVAPPALARAIPANDVMPFHRRRWFAPAAGGAIAAALCLGLLLPTAGTPGATTYVVATPPGASRTVTLEDGTRIEMNGGTALTLDHADPRVAVLDHGEAVFHVRHDAAHPFELTSAGATIRDLGTVFNVARSGDRLDVGVAEGKVMYAPGNEAITLRPGMQLRARDDLHRITIGRTDAAEIGAWRHGRLAFREEPLATVAESVERATGARLAVSPALAATPFTGTLRLAGGAEAVIPRLARLSGASWGHAGGTWSLSKEDGEAR